MIIVSGFMKNNQSALSRLIIYKAVRCFGLYWVDIAFNYFNGLLADVYIAFRYIQDGRNLKYKKRSSFVGIIIYPEEDILGMFSPWFTPEYMRICTSAGNYRSDIRIVRMEIKAQDNALAIRRLPGILIRGWWYTSLIESRLFINPIFVTILFLPLSGRVSRHPCRGRRTSFSADFCAPHRRTSGS